MIASATAEHYGLARVAGTADEAVAAVRRACFALAKSLGADP